MPNRIGHLLLEIKIIASLIDCRWSCKAYAVALSASLFGDGETTMVLKSRQFYCWSELQLQKECPVVRKLNLVADPIKH